MDGVEAAGGIRGNQLEPDCICAWAGWAWDRFLGWLREVGWWVREPEGNRGNQLEPECTAERRICRLRYAKTHREVCSGLFGRIWGIF